VQEVRRRFEHLKEYMSVAPSERKGAEDGLRLTGGRLFLTDEIIGVYEGIVTEEPTGDYVLEVGVGPDKKYVDADPNKTGSVSIFGKMNEDLSRGEYNAELGEDGFIRIIHDCMDVELFTRYGNRYNWDKLKECSHRNLREDIEERFPNQISKIPLSWNAQKEDPSNLSRWIKRIVNGKTMANEVHGIEVADSKDDIEGLLSHLNVSLPFDSPLQREPSFDGPLCPSQ
jgi:hypothetical protein